MKISFVVQDLVGQGVQYATAIIAREFARRGWAVDVLVSQVHQDYLDEGKRAFPLPESVNLVCMPSRRGSRNGWFLRKYLRTSGSDVLVAESGIYTWCIRWAATGLRKTTLPILVQVVHGNVYPLPRGRLQRFILLFKFWLCYCKFSSVLFVNRKSEENFVKRNRFFSRLRTLTVNNAVVDDEFLSKAKLAPRHPWLVNKKCPTFVTAGSYTPGKCQLMAMEAFRLANQKRRARLIVFGRGYLEPEYREYIAKQGLDGVISVAGFTDQLPAEINASDGLISPSDEESFGITIVEALACGKPVISTDVPYGPREILADGKYGRLVPMNDSAAMAEAIVDFVDGKILPPSKESWERYTMQSIMQKYIDGIGI